MEQYLIDNNVISDYFMASYSIKAMYFISDVIDRIPNISVVTEIEALSWLAPDKIYEDIITEFVENANILPLSKKVVTECIQIRRKKKIKTPDAITCDLHLCPFGYEVRSIAATAIVHNLTLLTNDGDFKNIPNLKTLNPFEI